MNINEIRDLKAVAIQFIELCDKYLPDDDFSDEEDEEIEEED